MSNPFDRIAEPNQYAAWRVGWDAGHKTWLEEGVELRGQALLEQFIMFMQEAGYESAVMSLTQMHELRQKVDAVSSALANIEVYR